MNYVIIKKKYRLVDSTPHPDFCTLFSNSTLFFFFLIPKNHLEYLLEGRVPEPPLRLLGIQWLGIAEESAFRYYILSMASP